MIQDSKARKLKRSPLSQSGQPHAVCVRAVYTDLWVPFFVDPTYEMLSVTLAYRALSGSLPRCPRAGAGAGAAFAKGS